MPRRGASRPRTTPHRPLPLRPPEQLQGAFRAFCQLRFDDVAVLHRAYNFFTNDSNSDSDSPRRTAAKAKKKKKKKDKSKQPSLPAAASNPEPLPPSGTTNDEGMRPEEREEEVLIELSQPSLLSELLLRLQSLSRSQARCSAALRALLDGRTACAPLRGDGREGEEGRGSSGAPVADDGGGGGLASAPARRARAGAGDAPPVAAPAAGGPRGKRKGRGGAGAPSGGKPPGSAERPSAAASARPASGAGRAPRHRGSDDAHLLVAATQAVHVLLAGADEAEVLAGDETERGEHFPDGQASVLLIALARPLLAALVQDRPLLETVLAGFSEIAAATEAGVGDASSAPGGPRSSSPTEREERSDGLRRVAEHAKTVAGWALTSGVIGALRGLEGLGHATTRTSLAVKGDGRVTAKGKDAPIAKEDGVGAEPGGGTAADRALLRRAAWSSLLALETALQIHPQPRLLGATLAAGAVGVAALGRHGGSGSSHGGGEAAFLLAAAADSEARGEPMDFDRLLSAAMRDGGGGTSPSSVGHAHLTACAGVAEAWNDVLGRLAKDGRAEFRPATATGAAQTLSLEEETRAENDALARMCHEVSQRAFADKDDASLILWVLQNEGGATTAADNDRLPPSKKTRRAGTAPGRRRKTAKATARRAAPVDAGDTFSSLSALLSRLPENRVAFDRRVSAGGWAALALERAGGGPQRILAAVARMLACQEVWNGVLALPAGAAVEGVGAAADRTTMTPAVASKKKKRKDKRRDVVASASSSSEPLSGRLALIAFAACAVDTVHDASASVERMEDPVRAVASSTASAAAEGASVTRTRTAPVRRSSRHRPKTAQGMEDELATTEAGSSPERKQDGDTAATRPRPDLQDEAVLLAQLLVEAHTACLRNAFAEGVVGESQCGECFLVNDDDALRGGKLAYYPFVHRTLQTLGRTANPSSFLSRAVAIGSATALRCFSWGCQNQAEGERDGMVAVADAKLLSLAVAQLSECLVGHVDWPPGGRPRGSVGKSGAPSPGVLRSATAATALGSLPEDIVTAYRLNESLNVVLGNSEIAFASQAVGVMGVDFGDRSDGGPGHKGVGSYKGAFLPLPAEASGPVASFRGAPHPSGWSGVAEGLSIFIRAHIAPACSTESVSEGNPAAHGTAMASLLSSLLSIARCCYYFGPEVNTSQHGPARNKELSFTTMRRKTKKKKRKVGELTSVLEGLGGLRGGAELLPR